MDEIKEQFGILNGNLEEIDDTLCGIADQLEKLTKIIDFVSREM